MNKKNIIVWIVVAIIAAVAVLFAVEMLQGNGGNGNTVSLPVGNYGAASSTPPASSTAVSPVATSTSAKASATSTGLVYHAKDLGISFVVPAGWTLESIAPLSFDNFSHAFLKGGIMPVGGALIDMAATTIFTPLPDFIAQDIPTAVIASTSTLMAGGRKCAEVFYTDTYGSGVASNNVAAYCPHGSSLMKFYLSYRPTPQDSNGEGERPVAALNGMLDSLEFQN